MNVFVLCWLFAITLACGYCVWAINAAFPSSPSLLPEGEGGEPCPAIRGRLTSIEPDADIDHILPVPNFEEIHS
jgi:hypothetical protein